MATELAALRLCVTTTAADQAAAATNYVQPSRRNSARLGQTVISGAASVTVPARHLGKLSSAA